MAFDVITPDRLGGEEVAVSPALTTLRTTPVHARDIVKTIDIANTNAFDVTASVYLVPDGDSASNDNILLPAVNIPANGVLQWTGAQVTREGGMIQANASSADVCVTVSGGEAV